MSQLQVPPQLQPFVKTIRTHWKVWGSITGCCFVAAVLFAATKPDTWQATQSLVLRDEAVGQLSGRGRFDSLDTLKAAQELVVEVARKDSVLSAALKEVGPPPGKKVSATWPSTREIEAIRQHSAVVPPNGAEFGTTEVLHLSVQANQREYTVRLTDQLSHQLELALQDIRNRKADSVISELENAQTIAQNDLARATDRLKREETKIGSDLGELRSLNDASSGDGNLRNAWNQIRQQLRDSDAELARLQEQWNILTAAQQHPDQLIATPNQLLESQPALRRLKDGLVDAQLRTSQLQGLMSENHPQVQSAIAAEAEVRQHLREELAVALRGIEADLRVQKTRIKSITKQEVDVRTRLDNLAGIRAQYANLVADVDKCNQVLAEVHQQLADARANKKAAETTSLITRIDDVSIGENPVGPGRSIIAGAGLLGGLLLGMGVCLLLTPNQNGSGRRWSDRL